MAGMTLAEAAAHLTATDPLLAVGEADVLGRRLPVFVNTPQNLRELQQYGRGVREYEDFIVYEDERLTYTDYCAESCRVSALLRDHFSVRKGDRVAIAMRNYPEYLTLLMGIVNLGAVAVLVNAWWTAEELAYGFSDSGAKLAFADGPRHARLATFAADQGITLVGVRDAPAEEPRLDALLAKTPEADWPETPIAPDDDFGVLYSSGTTGHPKGVALTHRGAISAVFSWYLSLKLPPLMAPEGVELPPPQPAAHLCATPLFHVTATHPLFLLAHPTGAKFVMMRKWDGEAALRLINREKVTRFLGVPTMSADLAAAAKKLGIGAPTLESLGAGGAKRPGAQVAEQAAAFPGTAVGSGWGMTETNAIGLGIGGPDYEARPEATGRLYPPLQKLRIVDDDGNEVPNGVVGELTVLSAANMRCYLNKPEATAEALKDGWLHTGDLAHVDDEGYVFIVDRKKNIIIRGGENISCLEVEGAIHRHPAVAEAAVFPVPDDRLGEIVGAGIQLRPGAALTAGALAEFLGEHIAGFKIPARIWWSDGPLTRGATDKIDRRAHRAACLEGRFGAPAQP